MKSVSGEQQENVERALHEQALDAAEALEWCLGAMDSMATQIEQMKGLFNDDDGAIERSLEEHVEAEAKARQALARLRRPSQAPVCEPDPVHRARSLKP